MPLTMSESSILYTIEGQVARVLLNRPQVFNSFNREMALSLQEVLQDCKENPEVRAIYLSGGGKAFCAGQDINELQGDDVPSFSTILNEHYNPIINRIIDLEKPVVCAVNGVAAGAGANLALACDITVASEQASFIQAFSKIGLIPDSGGTYTLPRLIGRQRASALMMLGDKIDANTAVQMGMIYKAFSAKSFEKESWGIAERLSHMPTRALGMIKKALIFSMTSDLDRQLSMETELQGSASRTEDFKEGIQAFLEKRAPVFKGS